MVRGPGGGAAGFWRCAGDLRPDRDQRRRLPDRDRRRGRAGFSDRRHQHRRSTSASSVPRSPKASGTGSSPAASCTPASSTSASTCSLLFFLGRLLEPALGTPRFLALYFASLLAGSFGALLLDPNALTVGASGAVFGLFGAAFVIARGRGMNALAGELGFLIVINLVVQLRRPRTSASAATSAAWSAASICAAGDRRRRARACSGRNHRVAEMAVMVAVGVVAFVGALAVA